MSIQMVAGTIATMAVAANPRITVELEAGANPIRGSIEYADGRRQEFWGWLELIDELGRLAANQPQSRSRRRRDSGGQR